MAIAKRAAPRGTTKKPAKQTRARPTAKKPFTTKAKQTLARSNATRKLSKQRAPARFARTRAQAVAWTSKVRNWQAPWGDASSTDHMTEFLGRLWALFGRPNDQILNGFGWVLRDQELGLVVTAYSAGTGPSFGANRSDEQALQSIAALEALVNDAKPVDCRVKFFDEYSSCDITIGIEGGRHFLF